MQKQRVGAYAVGGALVIAICVLLWSSLQDSAELRERAGSSTSSPVATRSPVALAPPSSQVPTLETASTPGPSSNRRTLSEPAEQTQELSPRGGIRLEGTVRDVYGRAAVGAKVLLNTTPPRSVRSDAQGAYRFGGVTGSELLIRTVSADGGSNGQTYVQVDPAEQLIELDLYLLHTGSLTVVLDRALPEFELTVIGQLDDHPRPEWVEAISEYSYLREDGEPAKTRFRLTDELILAPGQYDVILRGYEPDGQAWASGSVRLKAGGQQELLLQPRPAPLVSVQIRANGVATAGVVYASSASPGLRGHWFPDEFLLNPGEPIELNADLSAPAEFRFDNGSSVRDHDPGLIFDFGEQDPGVATDGRGRLTLAVPPGRWVLRADCATRDAGRAEQQIEVVAGHSANVVLDLPTVSGTALIRCPRIEGDVKFEVYGPPGLRLKGQGSNELLLKGLQPEDSVFVFAHEELPDTVRVAATMVGPGQTATLAFQESGQLDVELEIKDHPEADSLTWPLHIEPVDRVPVFQRGELLFTADADELWGEYSDVGPDPMAYATDFEEQPEVLERLRAHVYTDDSFTLFPGQYRVTALGWPEPNSQLVTVSPGGAHTVKLRLQK